VVQIFEPLLIVKNTIKNNTFFSEAIFGVYNREHKNPEKKDIQICRHVEVAR
jgi:hypothetical protein